MVYLWVIDGCCHERVAVTGTGCAVAFDSAAFELLAGSATSVLTALRIAVDLVLRGLGGANTVAWLVGAGMQPD